MVAPIKHEHRDATENHFGSITRRAHRSPEGETIPTVRDLDVAKRAGLAVPRDIRRTIKALIDAGEVEVIPEGTNGVGGDHANLSPRVQSHP
jgi:hypothetical protein